MKLHDLRVGTQMRLGVGLILAMVLALGVLSRVQSDAMWTQTKDLYEHPFLVRRAVGALEADILSVENALDDLSRAANASQRDAAHARIDERTTDGDRQVAVLHERYLGPTEDLAVLERRLAEWTSYRAETVRLIQAGNAAEVAIRLRPGSAGDTLLTALLHQHRTIDTFASGKGIEYFKRAEETRASVQATLAVVLAVIVLVALAVAGLLLHGIRSPLASLEATAAAFRAGSTSVRVTYASANEFGALASTFNAMADAIAVELDASRRAAAVADALVAANELEVFCRALLTSLMTHTDSQLGAVYVLNAAKTRFERVDAIGLDGDGRAGFSATSPEGEFGSVLATHRMQRITDIPADSRFHFAAVSGTFTPREIITVPVLAGDTVVAMISLASLRSYGEPAVRLLSDISHVLTARTSGVLAFTQTRELAERLDHQNRELDTQKRELSAQSSELTQQNTELELQRRQLDEANRLKSAFLSNMSHELRTPLNSVIALSGVLHRRLAGAIPEQEYGFLEVIERNGKGLLAMINDILDLSRIEAGRADVSIGRFSMRELTDDVVAMLAPIAEEKGIVLENRMGRDLPLLESDADKCRHILQNLIGNAVKFTETGSVTITARLHARRFYVTVTDTGVGIASQHFVRIFDEFRQSDDSTTRKFGGTGLGLAIAKKYAALLHGDIAVESALGTGSAFTLRLPLALEASERATPGAATASFAARANGHTPEAHGDGRTILVVEDNESAIIQLTDILSRQGYAVRVARDGKAALSSIELGVPDAMVLDLMMPDVDGFQVLKAIRSVERTAHIPVLILTAKHVTREELSFLTGNHIHQLIQKGDVKKDELLGAIARMVAPPDAAATAADTPTMPA